MYDDEESEWDKMYEQMRNEKAWNYAIRERQEVDTVKELIGKLDVMSMSW